MEFSAPSTFLFLWLAGLLAGFVDSIAGGGGLIALPALLAAGLPPHMALGTNKLQSSFGSLTASINYTRKGLVALRPLLAGIFWTAIGAAGGTAAIQFLSAGFLRHIIPVLLMGVFVYLIAAHDRGATPGRQRLSPFRFYLAGGLILGFYDGFFGPGTGSFWALAFVMLLGLDLRGATAHTKITNFTSNAVSLAAFIAGGKVFFWIGIIMGSGQIMGAFLGSRLVIRRGVRLVRAFLLAVVALTILKLAYDTYRVPV